MTDGTPKTLTEAISNGASSVYDINRVIPTLHEHVRDFLAQKFNVAYLKAKDDGELERLKELFRKVTL